MTVQDPIEPPTKYKLTVADYLALNDSGALSGLRTQLIEGEIIVMNPQFRPHARVKMALYDSLRDALRAMDLPLRPLTEASLQIKPNSFVDPDIVLTDQPDGEGPVPLAATFLLVEVSDTTLKIDLEEKAPLYAAAGVPEYWVADVRGRVIHQMWAPAGDAFSRRRRQAFGEVVEAATISGLQVQTGDVA